MSTYWTNQIPVHLRTSRSVYVHYQNMDSLSPKLNQFSYPGYSPSEPPHEKGELVGP